MVTTIVRTISDKGGDLFSGRSTSGRLQREQGTTARPTGVITTVLARGIGSIGRDERSVRPDLTFDRTAVEGDGFDRLRQGQRVRFDQEPMPGAGGRRHAVRVAPIAGEDPA